LKSQERSTCLGVYSEQLGHDSTLTVNTSGHLGPGTDRRALERLDDAIGRNQPLGRGESMSEDKVQVTGTLARVYYRQG